MRRAKFGAAALLATLAVAMPARADDPGVVEACNKAGDLPRPADDSAGPAPKGCDALALYYGIGREPDYRAARACALNGRNAEDMGIGADAILSMIFANGLGVARDVDLAIAYACDAGGAPAEITGRVNHLLDRKTGKGGSERFDFCDDITSGMMQGACAARDSQIAGVKRDASLAGLTRDLPLKAKTSYATLHRAFDAYRREVGDNEVDMSGTARGAMSIEAQEAEAAAFVETLRLVLSARPVPAGRSLADADAALNAAYRKIQDQGALDDRMGTVTKDGVKSAQRAWLSYRDAFLAFAKAAGARTSAGRLAAALTERRTRNLEAFLVEDGR